MQYVYKIELLNKYIYIGTTNKLRRRKDQHNENARKEKSYFGKFLKQHNIELKTSDLQVLSQFTDRREAFKEEARLIKHYDICPNKISLNYEKTMKRN